MVGNMKSWNKFGEKRYADGFNGDAEPSLYMI